MSLRDNPGAAISGGAHLVLLAAILLSFSHAAKFDDAQETVPVDLMSNSEFNQIMKGEKTAKLSAKPLQSVEKLADNAEAKPQSILPPTKTDVPAPQARAAHDDDPGREEAKIPPVPPARPPKRPPSSRTRRRRSRRSPSRPSPNPPNSRRSAGSRPTQSSRSPSRGRSPNRKSSPLSSRSPSRSQSRSSRRRSPSLNSSRTSWPSFWKTTRRKIRRQSRPRSQKSGDQAADPTDKFDLSDISRILNKDMPQRKAATGEALQQVASLGAPTASAAKMSPSLWGQLDGILQDQYRHCWNYIGVEGQEKYVPQIHVQYAQDGALIGEPQLMNPPTDPNLRSLADSAMRAVRRCNPLRIPAQYQPYYDQWKGRIVRFDPEDML